MEKTLAEFTILERLGAGALGEVFRAHDAASNRTVALRVISPAIAGDAARRAELLADARAVQSFAHPHVAALLEIVEDGDRLALVHEHVVGQSLAALAAGRPLDPRMAITIAAQLGEALGAAASRGLPHRALDPASVLVAAGEQAKILDFGLWRWTSQGQARGRTAAAVERGQDDGDARLARAACYVAPEQVLGFPGDGRSDVFALGVVFYEMLTGHPPFVAETVSGTALKAIQARVDPPSALNAAVPPEADVIAARAMSKSLDARYHDAGAMAVDLRALRASMRGRSATLADRQWVGAASAAEPVRAGSRRSGAGRRWMLLAWCLGVVLLAAVGWVVVNGFSLPWRPAPPAAPPRAVVMVLPFTVGGETTPAAYLGPGFAEEVAARLGEIPGATVVGRASTRATDSRDWRRQARKLGAVMAVSGSIRPVPGAWQADVALLDAATGAPTWSQHFAREPRHAAAPATEIAAQVALRFHLALPTSARWSRASGRQVDLTAFDLYLQGRDAADHRDRSRAIGLYDQALERDPRLVEARAGLSQALYLEDFYAGGNRDPAMAGRSRREAEAALAVDPELPAAHVAAALAAPTLTEAASSLARALAFDPSNGEAWHHAGDLVAEVNPRRSIDYYRASLALEPTIDSNWRDIAAALAGSDQPAEAERALVSGEAARPDRPWWRQMRARLDMERQQYDRAATALLGDATAETTPVVWLMGRVVPLALVGRAADARKEAERLTERYPGFCEGRAVLAALELDSGDAARGRALGGEILAGAGLAGADPGLLGCAALAAASLGDSAQAATWLSRVAGDERALRPWMRQAIFGPGMSFRLRWYPWNKVSASKPMEVAASQLEASIARLRGEVERRLPAPPVQAPPAAR